MKFLETTAADGRARRCTCRRIRTARNDRNLAKETLLNVTYNAWTGDAFVLWDSLGVWLVPVGCWQNGVWPRVCIKFLVADGSERPGNATSGGGLSCGRARIGRRSLSWARSSVCSCWVLRLRCAAELPVCPPIKAWSGWLVI